MKTQITRRRFLRTATVGGAGLLILRDSRLAFAYDANSKLNVAGIGVGGQGRSDLDAISGLGVNLVALCDVDQARAADTFKKYPQAKPFKDFRRMLDEMEKQIDAVVVATPDHTHAIAAVAAMKRGKHVYCEKPLTRTVSEARLMRQTAAQCKVVTQMGNQGSAENRLRRGIELVWGGVIGEVREAHVWFDGGNGPMKRPTDTPPVPETLDWDLWLGPAPERPYHPDYLPAKWRGWRAFGTEDLLLGYPRGGWGDLLIGSKGSIYSDCPWNSRYVLLPESKFDNFKGGPPETLPRANGHQREWVDACKGLGHTFSGFEIGGPMTELMQLANLATQVASPLEYDTVQGRILNSDHAEQLLSREYRKGWAL